MVFLSMELFAPACQFGQPVPLLMGHFRQVVELSRTLKPFAAIDGDHVTINITGIIGDEIRGEIS